MKQSRMGLKDWAQIVFFSSLMLIAVVTVMMGVQAVIIDTGRAIVHK